MCNSFSNFSTKKTPITSNFRLYNDYNLHLPFQVSEKTNRLANETRGKGKKGAQGVDERAFLAFLVTEDGARHAVRACARGKIVEVSWLSCQNGAWYLLKRTVRLVCLTRVRILGEASFTLQAPPV